LRRQSLSLWTRGTRIEKLKGLLGVVRGLSVCSGADALISLIQNTRVFLVRNVAIISWKNCVF
jgi:hypothetical protein